MRGAVFYLPLKSSLALNFEGDMNLLAAFFGWADGSNGTYSNMQTTLLLSTMGLVFGASKLQMQLYFTNVFAAIPRLRAYILVAPAPGNVQTASTVRLGAAFWTLLML